MQIQINTDSNIESDAERIQQMKSVVGDSLDRFSQQLTRVEVHISDQNSDKKFAADDIRCLLEARLTGLQPISVSDSAETIEQAVSGALEKLTRSLSRTIERLGER